MKGSCLCGQVVFEATPDRHVIACHCSQCRKQSGHFWAATFAWHKDFHLVRDDGLRWYAASDQARRGFCAGCGAFLFWQPTGEVRVSIAAGAFDGPTGLHIGENWHNEDAGDYYDPAGGPPPPPSDAPLLQGSCLCRSNRFTLPGPMGEVWSCHCGQCRKTSGHFAASFDAEESAVHWLARKVNEHRSPGGGVRGFCQDCGSGLYFRAADGAFSMEAGSIDGPTGGQMARHIFVADKGDYYDLTDGLPQN
jgi:hypothetical protein